MKIKHIINNDVVIITINGKMMGGPETQELHDYVKDLMSKNHKKFIFILKGVPHMNSSGLGILMAIQSTLKNSDGHMKLAAIAKSTKSLLMITQMIKIFKVYDNVEKALESFKKNK